MTMHTLRRGLLAGILASLVLALLDFVTDGAPGNGFLAVLHWFGLTIADPTISHWAGFLLLLVLGGVLWWLLFEVVLANLTNHAPSPSASASGNSFLHFP
jgi:hypothetical protein